jgi:hypothetical protein
MLCLAGGLSAMDLATEEASAKQARLRVSKRCLRLTKRWGQKDGRIPFRLKLPTSRVTRRREDAKTDNRARQQRVRNRHSEIANQKSKAHRIGFGVASPADERGIASRRIFLSGPFPFDLLCRCDLRPRRRMP